MIAAESQVDDLSNVVTGSFFCFVLCSVCLFLVSWYIIIMFSHPLCDILWVPWQEWAEDWLLP